MTTPTRGASFSRSRRAAHGGQGDTALAAGRPLLGCCGARPRLHPPSLTTDAPENDIPTRGASFPRPRRAAHGGQGDAAVAAGRPLLGCCWAGPLWYPPPLTMDAPKNDIPAWGSSFSRLRRGSLGGLRWRTRGPLPRAASRSFHRWRRPPWRARCRILGGYDDFLVRAPAGRLRPRCGAIADPRGLHHACRCTPLRHSAAAHGGGRLHSHALARHGQHAAHP
ncbi:hypothetical protein QE399_000806 [Paracidovorax wautersii]|uniref:Uncharacterized protein n=1 Tax=Paracidovorax wautersii TaxID=1177982 RepID=A0ABU1I7D0_9BURK|nr:hypothetical protein [Paracidovorax wautersii]